jgi:iron complex outermembrane receptor protein
MQRITLIARASIRGRLRSGVAMVCAIAAAGATSMQAVAQEEVGEVIVTATRRDTTLRDAPVTISAFTEADIEARHIVKPGDFLSQVSNVNLTTAVRPGESDVSMRGIQGNFGLTQPVAVVVDGVVAANPNALDQQLVGIQQIEVVKGPQSALYGRNANAGAIVITTKRPTQQFEGKVVAGTGNGGAVKAQALFSGPLFSEKLSGRIALSHDDRDGFWDNETVGRPSDPFRQQIADARVIFEATGQLTLDLRAKASRMKEGSQLWDVQVPPFIAIDNNHYFPDFQANNAIPGRQKRYDYSLKADYQLPIGVLTAVASHDDYASKYFADGALHTLFPGGPPTIFVDPDALMGATPPLLPGYSYSTADGNAFSELNQQDKTLELRLTSRSDQRFRWFLGGYYSDSRRTFYGDARVDTGGGIVPEPLGIGLVPGSVNPIISVAQNSVDWAKDEAAFGQIQFDLLPNLTPEISLRYDHEEKRNLNGIPAVNSPVTGQPLTNPVLAPSGLVREATYKKYQPKYTLRYKPVDSMTLFASYGVGFRSGGFNGAGSGAAVKLQAPDTNFPDAFPAEVSHASEVGFKGEWLEHRLRVNGALFHTKVDDAQAFTAFPAPPITIVISLENVRSQGAELEVSYRVTEDLRISNSFGYTDTRIRKTVLPTAVGKEVPGTPDYTNNFSIDWAAPLARNLRLQSHIEWNLIGPMWFDVYNTPGTDREKLNLANMRIALESARDGGGRWSIGAWSNNLFDKHYNVYAAPVPPIANFSYRAAPRSYGLDVTYNF